MNFFLKKLFKRKNLGDNSFFVIQNLWFSCFRKANELLSLILCKSSKSQRLNETFFSTLFIWLNSNGFVKRMEMQNKAWTKDGLQFPLEFYGVYSHRMTIKSFCFSIAQFHYSQAIGKEKQKCFVCLCQNIICLRSYHVERWNGSLRW